jgi:hypothetical protein
MAAAAAKKPEPKHGVPGVTCTSCTECRICDCECQVCTHARRREAGLVCADCNKDCGFSQCDDCYDKEQEERDRAEEESWCDGCGEQWCLGGTWCDGNRPPDDDSDDEEMRMMMEEQREEEDRRFRAQMARYHASKPTYTGPTITVTLTATSATVTSSSGAAAGAGGGK